MKWTARQVELRAVNLRFPDSVKSPQESKARYVDHG
jgi:hypothetical protein